MTFLWPEMLWLLLLIPFLVLFYVWILGRRKRSVVRYANLPMVKAAMGSSAGWRRHVPPVLMLLALTALIVGIARPQAVVTLASSRATVILAMDVSGSMRADDVEPNRIEAAQAAAKKFISEQPANVQIGLVAFAGIALLAQAPTLERDPLYQAIDNFELRRGTAVGSGVLTSLKTIFPDLDVSDIPGATGDPFARAMGLGSGTASGGIENRSIFEQPAGAAPTVDHVPVPPGSYGNAVIILLTDGATTVGPDPLDAGQRAADYGVKVYTVGFGSQAGAVVSFAGRSMRAALDETTLREIARRTTGEYFEARSADDLNKVYGSLSARLVGEKKLTDIAFIFAGIGAVLAMLGAGLSLLWFGRLA